MCKSAIQLLSIQTIAFLDLMSHASETVSGLQNVIGLISVVSAFNIRLNWSYDILVTVPQTSLHMPFFSESYVGVAIST